MIGKLIKQRRLELGLTQEELAQRLGYKHKSAVNKLEMNKNDVNQTKLIKIAQALECSPLYFVEDVKHDTPLPEDVLAYAEKLSRLPPDKLDNAMKYIDFLSKEEQS